MRAVNLKVLPYPDVPVPFQGMVKGRQNGDTSQDWARCFGEWMKEKVVNCIDDRLC